MSARPSFSSTLPEPVDFLENGKVKIKEQLDTTEADISLIEVKDDSSISKPPPLDLSKIPQSVQIELG